MNGIGGKTEYLDELYELYDEYETISNISVLERVRITGCTYGEAMDYYERLARASEADAIHGHVEARMGAGR